MFKVIVPKATFKELEKYNVLLCQDHLTKHSYFTHYATNRNS